MIVLNKSNFLTKVSFINFSIFYTKIQIFKMHFQINFAVCTNRLRMQWIDLGIHTKACMTNPNTCGAAGGAVSLWRRVIDCLSGAALPGVITTITGGSTGFTILCTPTTVR